MVSRIQNLLSIPVFVDEAIYVRWSQIIKSVETLRFIPLTDGKQPLFMWLTVPFFKIFSDPLFAGRFVSVLAGLGSLIFLFLISRFLKLSNLTTIFLLLLYCFSPFTFFFDRLALADSLLSMFGILLLYLSLLQSKYLRLDIALILGTFLGLSWLTKSPAIFFVALSSFTILISKSNLKSVLLSALSTSIAFIIYNLLRLGPQFHMIAIRNKDYLWSITDILKHPLDPLKPHLSDIVTLYHTYLPGLFIVIFVLIVIHLLLHKKIFSLDRTIFIVSLWWLAPLFANAIFAKVFTARYILYTVPPLLLLLMLVFDRIKLNSKIKLIFIIITLIPSLILLYRFSFSPFKLLLPSTETGYVNDWTSGWGIHDSANYLIDRSKYANVIVGTEGYFGTLPDGLQIYTNNTPHLTIFGVGVNLKEIPPKLIDAKNFGDEVYLLINTTRLYFLPEKLEIVRQYPKPDGSQLLLIRI